MTMNGDGNGAAPRGASLKGFSPWDAKYKRPVRITETRVLTDEVQVDDQGEPVAIEFTATGLDDLDTMVASDAGREWCKMYLKGGWLLSQEPMHLIVPGEHRLARVSEQFLYDAATVRTALELPSDWDTDSEVLYWYGLAENFRSIWEQLGAWINDLSRRQREANEARKPVQRSDEEVLAELHRGN